MFKCNVGLTDKVVRLIVGGALLAWGCLNSSIILDALGILLLLTGYFSFCGLYKLLNISTCN